MLCISWRKPAKPWVRSVFWKQCHFSFIVRLAIWRDLWHPCCIGGGGWRFQNHPQIQWFSLGTNRTWQSCCTHCNNFIQPKDTGYISEERKRVGQNPGETYLQAYGCPCTVELDRQFLVLLVTVWDNMYEVLLIRKAHLSLGAWNFYWGLVM